MLRIHRPLLACMVSGLLALPAHADLTAEDVWTDWQTYFDGLGYTIEGKEELTSDGLLLTGITLVVGDETVGQTRIEMSRITMDESEDGTVIVSLPSYIPVEMSSRNEMGNLDRISLDYRHNDFRFVASGSPEALQYKYNIGSIALETTGFDVGGVVLSDDEISVSATLEDLNGRTGVISDGQRLYDQEMTLTTLRYTVQALEPKTGNASEISGQVQDMAFKGKTQLPLRDFEPGDMNALLAAGFETDGTFTSGANLVAVSLENGHGRSDMSVIAGSGSIDVDMDQGGLSYSVLQNDLTVEATSAQFPVPLSFGVAQSRFNLSVPVHKSDLPGEFALGVSLDGIEIADMLWGLFDPTKQLPRDPASVALDISGMARLLINFLDLDEVASFSPEDAPAEIESLDINRVQIEAAGAKLSGTGGFVFDTSDTGEIRPNGGIDLELRGANTLLDRLGTIGLMQEQEATGIRMMMALLAQPGDEPDVLLSKIELNEQGHVLANGQRIR